LIPGGFIRKSMKVLSFGEILFDIIEGQNHLGGAPLNFAAHLARLGASSSIFSKVGNDALGKTAIDRIKKFGIETKFIEVDEKKATGTVEVELTNGQPDYTIKEHVAYDYIDFNEKEEDLLSSDFDVLYFGTLAQRNEQSRKALSQLIDQKKYKHIFYDVNLRKGFYSAEIINHSLIYCTILKLNNEEVEVLSKLLFQKEFSIQQFSHEVEKKYNISIVVITAGDKGCYIYENGELNFVKGYPANVVDTVGAGDSFSAAFIYQYYNTNDVLKAADLANKIGAFVASSRGALPAYSPDIIELLELE
jgi:fructokinase